MDAMHYDGVTEYFAHNLYGHMESEITANSLRFLSPWKRPFVLTRSSFAGTGRYAAHWLGDNWSTWESYRASIPGLLNFASLFGIPMVGADICGFLENTTEELCARWMQFGAIAYPFARNHNWNEGEPQEPYLWKSVAEVSRIVLRMRYKMLPFWYTLMELAHRKAIPPVQPLAFLVTPGTKPAFAQEMLENERQVLLGGIVMVSPALEPGLESVSVFFPPGVSWYDLRTGQRTSSGGATTRRLNVTAPEIGLPPIHLRVGSILALFDVALGSTKTVTQLAKTGSYQLMAALDVGMVVDEAGFHAKGSLYADTDAFRDENNLDLQQAWTEYRIQVDSSLLDQQNELRIHVESSSVSNLTAGSSLKHIQLLGLRTFVQQQRRLVMQTTDDSSSSRYVTSVQSTLGTHGFSLLSEDVLKISLDETDEMTGFFGVSTSWSVDFVIGL